MYVLLQESHLCCSYRSNSQMNFQGSSPLWVMRGARRTSVVSLVGGGALLTAPISYRCSHTHTTDIGTISPLFSGMLMMINVQIMIVMLIVQVLADNDPSPIPTLNMRFEKRMINWLNIFKIVEPIQCDLTMLSWHICYNYPFILGAVHILRNTFWGSR